jgi:hypothetical protein
MQTLYKMQQESLLEYPEQMRAHPERIPRTIFARVVSLKDIAFYESIVESYRRKGAYPEENPQSTPAPIPAGVFTHDYSRMKADLYVPKDRIPGFCGTCGEPVKDITVPTHKDSTGDSCVISWELAIRSGARTPRQAQNLGIEPWASRPPYPEF